MRFFSLIILILTYGFSGPAFAHIGHLGELAGHAHWVGVVSVLGAAGLAAVLAKGKTRHNEEQPEEEAIENEGETGETA